MSSRISIAVAAMIAAVTIVAGSARAEWPERPITFIVPYASNGVADETAREFAKLLGEGLGVRVDVANRPSDMGMVGHLALAKAEPDGYTIGAISAEIALTHWVRKTDMDYTWFEPIAMYVTAPPMMIVPTDSPFRSAAEVVAQLRADPTSFTATGGADISVSRLAYVELLDALGLDWWKYPWIGRKGSAPAAAALRDGQANLYIGVRPLDAEDDGVGGLRPLAVFSGERNHFHPDVPAFNEATVVDLQINEWVGLATPRGVPDDIRARLLKSLETIRDAGDFDNFVQKLGFDTRWLGPVEFGEFMAEQDALMGDRIEELVAGRSAAEGS